VYLAVFHLGVLLDNDWIWGTLSEHKAFRNVWGWPKKDEMRITYTSDTGSLSFWLILYNSRPIYHRQSTDFLPTINGQSIGRVSGATSTEISDDSRSICQPTLGRYLGRYISQVTVDMSTNIPVKCQSICRPIHQSSVGRYVDQYIGRGVHKFHMIQLS